MKRSVMAPRHGSPYMIHKDGRVIGIFVIEGRRLFRTLCRIKEVERSESGYRRTDAQINKAITRLWEERRAEMEAEQDLRRGDKRMIKSAMQEWIERAPDNGLSDETVSKHYTLMANQYIKGVGDHRLADISVNHVDRYKAHLRERGLGPVTMNMRLTRLRTFLNWARTRNYIRELPPIEKVREPRKIVRAPQPEHVRAISKRLLDLATNCPGRRQRYFYELHWMEFLFVLCCGVRRGGPFYAKWEHVFLEQGAMLLEKSKGGEELLFLPGTLLDYLRARRERYPNHVWLFDDGRGNLAYHSPHALTTAFRRHMEALGIAHLGIKPLHGFRANFATVNLNELGHDFRTVANLLNHSSPETTERAYLADLSKEKRRALVAFEREYLLSVIDAETMQRAFPQPQVIEMTSDAAR